MNLDMHNALGLGTTNSTTLSFLAGLSLIFSVHVYYYTISCRAGSGKPSGVFHLNSWL